MADMWQDQAAIESNGYVMRAVGLVPINQSGRGWLRATLGEVMSGGNMAKAKRFEGYKVLWLLREHKEPWTVPEICEELNIREATAMRHLKELWTFEFIHISGWED